MLGACSVRRRGGAGGEVVAGGRGEVEGAGEAGEQVGAVAGDSG